LFRIVRYVMYLSRHQSYSINIAKPLMRPNFYGLLMTVSMLSTFSLQITLLIIYMKKLLNSDWQRAVQFKPNTSVKSVTPVQITHHNSGLWLAERQQEIF